MRSYYYRDEVWCGFLHFQLQIAIDLIYKKANQRNPKTKL